MVPVQYYLIVAAIVFSIGVLGFIVRRDAIIVFMCLELMLNAVNLTFVALSRYTGNLTGQIGVFFVMVVAAAEAAVGLAIIISLFRSTQSIETSDAGDLKR
jgi:NADH-quinone oxidoreductase subunit K